MRLEENEMKAQISFVKVEVRFILTAAGETRKCLFLKKLRCQIKLIGRVLCCWRTKKCMSFYRKQNLKKHLVYRVHDEPQ